MEKRVYGYWIGGALLVGVGVGVYLYLKNKKKSQTNPNNTSTGNQGANTSTGNQGATASNLQTNDRPYKHINKRISDLRGIFNDIQIKGNQLVYKNGTTVSDDMKRTLYMTVTRNINSIKEGLEKDTSVNQETKNNLINLLNSFLKETESYLPPDKYNPNQSWYISALKNMIPTNFYLV